MGLVKLDLSSFNTSKVTYMNNMFDNCDSLEHIYIGDGWDVDNVTSSRGMFDGCTSLPNFDRSIIDKTGCPIYMELKQILTTIVHATTKKGALGRLKLSANN